MNFSTRHETGNTRERANTVWQNGWNKPFNTLWRMIRVTRRVVAVKWMHSRRVIESHLQEEWNQRDRSVEKKDLTSSFLIILARTWRDCLHRFVHIFEGASRHESPHRQQTMSGCIADGRTGLHNPADGSKVSWGVDPGYVRRKKGITFNDSNWIYEPNISVLGC